MRASFTFFSILVVGLFLFPGCEAMTGKELARMTIDSLSTPEHLVMGEATLPLKQGGSVAFWSDMDLAYDGMAELRFRVRVQRNDSDIALLEIDPMVKNITMGETKTELGGHTEWSFTGKNQEWAVPLDATYTFKAILTAEENPSLQIKKAGLLLKQ